MPAVTGNVRNITGSTMNSLDVKIIFTLNATNVLVSTGGVRPDNSVEVTPDSDGSFSVNLENTFAMYMDAHYRMRVEWRGPAGPERPKTLRGYLEAEIRVPSGGGRIEELLAPPRGPGGTPGPNGRIVWVSQTPPPNPRPWMLWLEQEPGPDPDPFDSRNTSDLHEWRP